MKMPNKVINYRELQAIRKHLMLDVKEASEYVASVSPRSWQRWEKGDVPIPKNINDIVIELIKQRNDLVKNLKDIKQIKFYPTFEQWLNDGKPDNKLDWRIWQSATAEIFFSKTHTELI